MTRHRLHRAALTPWAGSWPPLLLLQAAVGWGETSQQQARRNALVASTALLERRRERLDVEAYLAEHARHAEHTGHGGHTDLAGHTGRRADPDDGPARRAV